MKVAIYPGSFNPWHRGHEDILDKATRCFDKVIIAVGYNPEKTSKQDLDDIVLDIKSQPVIKVDGAAGRVQVRAFSGLLVDFVDDIKNEGAKVVAVIRGLRNGHDLQYEMNQQYWNEDLGLRIPIAYFICSRNNSHISSSMLRQLNRFRNENKEKKED